MEQNLKQRVRVILDDAFGPYPEGYRAGNYGALMAFAMALNNTIPEGLLIDALQAAIATL